MSSVFKIFMHCACVLLWTQALVACVNKENLPSSNNQQAPNIIIVLADDLGVGDLSLYGSPIKTPNIDALAQQGVQLTNFYASANVCSPSRAGLLTGRYPIRMGLAHKVVDANSGKGLAQNEVTLAEELQRAGYRTALVGKWHLGDEPEYWPTRHGFNDFFGVLYSNDMRPFSLYEGEQIVAQEIDQSGLTRQYTDRVLEHMRDQDKRPYFILLSHTFPHFPLFASEQFKGKSSAGVYGDAVEEIDASLGEIIELVDDNTVVVFTSDNGAWFEGSNANHRGTKGHTYDAGYRVPMIIKWHNKVPAATVATGLSINLDLLPTLLALPGLQLLPSNSDLDGKNIWDMLVNGGSSPHEYLYLFNNEDLIGVRSEQWKYLRHAYYRDNYAAFENFERGFGYAYPQLYRINESSAENYSVASNHPEVLREL